MSYPILTAAMFTPSDAKISFAEAKKLFRKYMLQIGYLDKQEVGDHVGYFADEMRQNEQYLKDELASKKADDFTNSEVAEYRRVIKALRRDIEKCTDAVEKASLESQVAKSEAELRDMVRYVVQAEADLRAFQEDKRAFLIEYINRQIQGPPG